jgi:hypothetical protein
VRETTQLEELLVEVVPGSSLAEATALEAIIARLVAQNQLSVPRLAHLLVQDI